MFVTGHAVVSYNNGAAFASLGESESGWEILENHLVEDINTDSGGDAPVDGVMRGTRIEARATYVEYDLIKAAIYAANPRGQHFTNVGKLYSSLAGRLVITPVPGTTAETDIGVGNSIVVYKAVVMSDVTTLIATKLRKGPITVRCYPDPVHSNRVYDIIATPTS